MLSASEGDAGIWEGVPVPAPPFAPAFAWAWEWCEWCWSVEEEACWASMVSARGPIQTKSSPHFSLRITTTPAASWTVIVRGFPPAPPAPAWYPPSSVFAAAAPDDDGGVEDDDGSASGISGVAEAWRAKREDATVDWVRRRETGCGEAWASRRPEGVARSAVWRFAFRFEARKEVRRFVRRRGVGWVRDIFLLFLCVVGLVVEGGS